MHCDIKYFKNMRFRRIEMFSLDAECIVPHLFLLHEHWTLSFSFRILFSITFRNCSLRAPSSLLECSVSALFAKADKTLLISFSSCSFYRWEQDHTLWEREYEKRDTLTTSGIATNWPAWNAKWVLRIRHTTR